MLLVRLFRHFRQMYGYFAVSALLFAAGIWYGMQDPPAFRELILSQLEGLQDAARQIGELENEQLGMFAFIFLNNAIKSAIVVYLGLLFGLFPLVFLLINGMVIGFLLFVMREQGADVADVLLYGILPHGILELPAIVIACAYGLKLGVLAMRRLAGRDGGELGYTLRLTLPLILFLAAVLLAAALVEATVTPWLMRQHFTAV